MAKNLFSNFSFESNRTNANLKIKCKLKCYFLLRRQRLKERSHCFSGYKEINTHIQPWWWEWNLIYPFYGIILQRITKPLAYS